MRTVLLIKGLGHVPSFKNKKRIARKRNGPLFLMTDPKTKKWMKDCADSFVSQLPLALAANTAGTSTAQPLQSLIAWCLPQDDCMTIIPEILLSARPVEKGEEGAVVIIESL